MVFYQNITDTSAWKVERNVLVKMGDKWPSLSPITRDLVEYREEGKIPHVNLEMREWF
jgi:hypothetical protein